MKNHIKYSTIWQKRLKMQAKANFQLRDHLAYNFVCNIHIKQKQENKK